MYTEEDIIRYENKITTDLKNITDRFMETQKLEVNEFMKLFEFIFRIACIQETPDVELIIWEPHIGKHTINKNRLYPLPNEIGLFGLNTYLYALFEQIYLIGVPKRATNYDREYDCPNRFVNHDQGHSGRIQLSMIGRNIQKFQIGKLIYYTIINDPNITQLEKQCHILNIWLKVHEFYRLFDDSVIYPTIIFRLTLNQKIIIGDSGYNFYELFKSFAEFTFSDDNVQFLFQLKEAWDRDPYIDNYQPLGNRNLSREYGWVLDPNHRFDLGIEWDDESMTQLWQKFQDRYIQGIGDKKKNNYYLYYILAEIYHSIYC